MYKGIRLWHLYLGLEITWQAWGFGAAIDFSPHAWRPYFELDIGPVHFYLAYEKPRR